MLNPKVMTILLSVLVSGCVTTTGDYCDIAEPMLFGSEKSIGWLLENDRALLEGIIVHNEQTKVVCVKGR